MKLWQGEATWTGCKGHVVGQMVWLVSSKGLDWQDQLAMWVRRVPCGSGVCHVGQACAMWVRRALYGSSLRHMGLACMSNVRASPGVHGLEQQMWTLCGCIVGQC